MGADLVPVYASVSLHCHEPFQALAFWCEGFDELRPNEDERFLSQ
jgi:hypothetical protein